MKGIVGKVAHYFRCGLTLVSPELNTRVSYLFKFKKPLNLKNPKLYNEKLLWIKLNYYNKSPIVKKCADKYLVREYVEAKGCGDILNELLFTYNDPEEIEWDKLPNSFAIKWNFGSGNNIIVSDKNKLDIPETIKKLKRMKQQNAYLPYSEMQYKGVKKKILIEKYLCDGHGILPADYKVMCFHGIADCVGVFLGRETGETTLYYFDENWNLLRINYAGMKAPEGFTLPKPEGIEKVFEYARILSEPFPFVRADFYLVDGKVYFGELTFTPCGSMDGGMPPSLDEYFGKKINLEQIKNFE